MQESLKKSIFQDISQGDIINLRRNINLLENTILTSNSSPDLCLNFLNNLLNQTNFLEMGGSIYIIKFVEKLLDKFPNQQTTQLLECLRNAHEKLDDLNFASIKKLIYQAIYARHSILLSDCIRSIEIKTTIQEKYFSENYFDLIMEIITKSNFLELDESWHLLMLLQDKWKTLSVVQKDRLIFKLEYCYGKSSNWMFNFVISEFLGKYFADEKAFQILCRLSKLESEESRALIPHSLEHIIKDSEDKDLSEKAYTALWQMRNDSSNQVRNEVDQSLQNLAIHGIKN